MEQHPVIIKKGLLKTPTIVGKGMGYVPDPKRKFAIEQVTYKADKSVALSDSRILRFSGPTLDQDGYPACVGFAFTSNQMRDEKLEHGVYYFSDADALDLYLECKKIDGYNGDGTYGGAAVQVLENRGLRCTGKWVLAVPGVWTSAVWRPFDTPRFYKISAYQTLVDNVSDICNMLDVLRRPILIGMSVDNQIYDPPATGVLPGPNGQVIGGHEMMVYGYKRSLVDSAGQAHGLCFAVKNSWGNGWGGGSGLKGGRIWMPDSWFNTYQPDFYVTTDMKEG